MKVWNTVKVGGAIICLALLAGTGIGTIVPTPDYAPVYVDQLTNTYFAPQCVPPERTALVPARISVAVKAGVTMDRDCRETGAFAQDGPPLTDLLLQWLGILPPRRYWWDDYKRPGTVAANG